MATKKKQTLIDFLNSLNKLDPDQTVYLGTKEGGSWIIIDKPQVIIDNLADIETRARQHAEFTLSSACSRCYMLPKKIVAMQKELRKADEVERGCIETDLYELEQTYAAAFNTRKKWTDILKNWVTFGDRAVLEQYTHETDDPGICCVVDGQLKGTMWWKGDNTLNGCDDDVSGTCTDED